MKEVHKKVYEKENYYDNVETVKYIFGLLLLCCYVVTFDVAISAPAKTQVVKETLVLSAWWRHTVYFEG